MSSEHKKIHEQVRPVFGRLGGLFAERAPKKGRRAALPTFIGLAAVILFSGLMAYPIEASETFAPKLVINIPTIEFSSVKTDTESGASSGYIDIPWIAEYARGAYSYAVVVAGLLAAVMMVVGGFYYLTAGGDATRVQKGKQHISDALVGLFLVFVAFIALTTINPDTVSFDALRIKRVARREFLSETDIQTELGSLAPEEAYANLGSGDPPADSLPPPPEGEDTLPPPVPGQWRRNMEAACGDRRGLSLPTYEARQQRLRTIVQAWYQIGGVQGGAVYVRGGSRNCMSTNAEPEYALASISQALPAHPELLRFTTGDCLEVVRRVSAVGRSRRTSEARTEARANASCAGVWRNDYNALVRERARAAGMLCGDCMSFMTHMVHYCFDGASGGEIYSNRMLPYRVARGVSDIPNCPGQPAASSLSCVRAACPPRGSPDDRRYVFRLATPSDEEIRQAVSLLRFGDVMTWQTVTAGHVFMYTGGGGLGFEIMEMGGGGDSDISSSGGELAASNAGIPIRVSGVRTTTSAESYLAQLVRTKRRTGGICVFAFRPLMD